MRKNIVLAIIFIISLTILFTSCNNENPSVETDSQKESVSEETSSQAAESLPNSNTDTSEDTTDSKTEAESVTESLNESSDITETETETKETESTTEKKVIITGKKEPTLIKLEELSGYDYTELFTITVNGENITVSEAYINSSTVKAEPGEYNISCTYESQNAVSVIIVAKTEYKVQLSQNNISIKEAAVGEYDFLSLFSATKDGEAVEITADMIETNLKTDVGKYYFTVTLGEEHATLTINVTPNYLIEGLVSFKNLELTQSQIEDYDFTDLFSLYVDGVSIQVTRDMIDTSSLNNIIVGDSYNIVLNYTLDKYSYSMSATVTIIPEAEVVISSKNIVTYPNAQAIDLTSLFAITKGDMTIPVTRDMITGEVDYKKSGLYEITLNYADKSAIATVEVKMGVVIQYASSDVITIKQGTDISSYAFDRDFIVIINGRRFTQIPASCIDKSQVDFSQQGTYEVTITINYNDKKPSGIGSVITLTPYTKTITYNVVKNTYSIDIVNDDLVLPKGTTSYNVFKNLSVMINGRKQTLTDNPEYVDSISCYAKVLSDAIDFSSAASQYIKIAVYPYGPDGEPVIVDYSLRIDSEIIVNANGAVVFDGNEFYVKDLFSITEGGNPVEVTNDMISGKVNTFIPGVYNISINYKGIVKTVKVVVYGTSMAGTYHSGLQTIAETTYDENDELVSLPTSTIGDMTISSEGKIVIRGTEATIIEGIDENTMRIMYMKNEYLLHYSDGIIVLNPDNSIKLSFHENKRPLIYFNSDNWTISDRIVLNYSNTHVLQNNITSYSIDAFLIESLDKTTNMWYALKINLVEKSSADTVYVVSWGEAQFSEGFNKTEGESAQVTLDDYVYNFTMLDNTTGKIIKGNDNSKQWANRVFTGVLNGLPATLETDEYEHFTLKVNGESVLFTYNSILSNLKYGGIDHSNGIVYIYYSEGKETEPYAYKFLIDAENNTFKYVQKDLYFGKYVYNNMYIFLDGYGNGVVNFNTKYYSTTHITYQCEDGELSIRYHNTTPTFSYGDGASFYMAPLLNVLTVKEFEGADISGAEFENVVITDGAIVDILSYQLGSSGSNKSQLLNQIVIKTKDGILTETQKSALVNTSAVKFNKAGFYQFTITINVGGEDIVSYYALQIMADTYADSQIVGYYGGGIINSGYNLTVNKYGQVSLAIGSDYYEGMGEITEQGFFSYVYNQNRNFIILKGKLISDGIIEVSGSGQVNFNDIYTKGTVSIAGYYGVGSQYLRCINSGSTFLYYLSSSEQSLGYAVMVKDEDGNVLNSIDNGSIVLVYKSETDQPQFIKLNKWGDKKTGITLSDGLRGTYTSDGKPDLYLNGFGKVTVNGNTYDYKNSDTVITVTVSTGNISLYKLSKSSGTYVELAYTSGNAMLEGKSFSATHMFSCGYYSYSADTTFTFGTNGVVTIYSVSEEHDNDCEEGDLYSPSFASKTGINGTYSVSGDRVTITSGGETFVFFIPNVLTASQIICESTTVQSDEHGQFRVNTVFAVVA